MRFGRFGASGWYRWNRSWVPIPEPLWTEPMLDKVAHLQALIDAVACSDANDALAWEEVLEDLLAAATPQEDDRGA